VKARWVSEDPAPVLPGVGRAIVASWIPGRFHQITTLQISGQSRLARLTEAIASARKLDGVKQGNPFYTTQIIKCSKDGISQEDDYMNPVYEKDYETLDEAKNGHKTIVALFVAGKPLPPATI
jgi:hypothetical protein